MHVKTLLKAALPVLLLTVLFQGCNSGDSAVDYPGGGGPQFPVTSSSLPILQMNNWWKYSDADGHRLSISVIDTITSNSVKYYELYFVQQAVDSGDEWFIQNSGGTEYGGKNLTGPYQPFLPSSLNSQGGFSSDSSTVGYVYSDSTSFNGASFRYVFRLTYSKPFYHGFDEVDLADSIGIIRMAATTGQIFPVIYQIDSAFVGGKVTRY